MQNKGGRKSSASKNLNELFNVAFLLLFIIDSVFPHIFGQQHAADHRDQKSSSAYRHQQKSITHWKVQTHRVLDLQDR